MWQHHFPGPPFVPGVMPGGKYPIPRLSEGAAGSLIGPSGRTTRRHVSRACEFCRQRKTKCSGDASGCVNCQDAGIICCYTDSKKEKSKRQLNSMEAKISSYEKVLKIVGDWNGLSGEDLVNLALSEESSPNKDGYTNPTQPSGSTAIPPLNLTTGPSRVLDYTSVDFNLDDTSRSTGYIGRSSEIYWMHALNREINSSSKRKSVDSNTSTQHGPHGDDQSIASFNYNLDHLEIASAEGIERFPIPLKGVCWHLFDIYRASVHPLFPIIGIAPFKRQLESFFNKSMQPGNRWLAILHLIVAIASRYTFLTHRRWRYDQLDHFSHFLKVKALNIDNQVLSHPDMQQLQIEGLASFYLLAMGYVNRAWFLCGSALRRAFALGLHLRNVGGCTLDSREIRYRVWWSLYTLEHRLCVMTGRLSIVPDNVLTTPLLLPFDEGDFPLEEVQHLLARSAPSPSRSVPLAGASTSASSGESKQDTLDWSHLTPCNSLYFIQLVKLTIITKKMSNKLYNPESVPSLWSGMKYAMRDLIVELEAWLMNLPKFYDFSSPTNSSSVATERMTLALMFYSAKLAITRPCLGPSDPEQKGQNGDREFCKKNAVDCVEAACHVIRLLPEPPDTDALYTLFPWWNIIHFLMQATVVLFIEASLNFEHIPQKVPMVLRAIKKSLEWMSVMSATSNTAGKARRLCEHFLDRLEIQLDVEDSNPSKPESDSAHSSSSEDDALCNPPKKRAKFQEQTAESDPPLMLRTYQPGYSTSTHTMGASGASGTPSAMDALKPSNYAFADELLPFDQNTGMFTDSIFPPGDPPLNYTPDSVL